MSGVQDKERYTEVVLTEPELTEYLKTQLSANVSAEKPHLIAAFEFEAETELFVRLARELAEQAAPHDGIFIVAVRSEPAREAMEDIDIIAVPKLAEAEDYLYMEEVARELGAGDD